MIKLRPARSKTFNVGYSIQRFICRAKPIKATYELDVRLTFWPGRPAPQCSNPDSLRYSDPGHGPDLEIEMITVEAIFDENIEELAPGPDILKGSDIEFTKAEILELMQYSMETLSLEDDSR